MAGRTLRKLVKFELINKSIFDEDGPCILIPEEQLNLLREKKPIFVQRKGLPLIEIYCSNHDRDTPIFKLSDVILVSESEVNQIDDFKPVEVQTRIKQKVYLLRKTN